MKHSIDELMLQRCVDGELSDHERADLLAKLHEQGSAENWKSLALTFVEHQVFSNVFADDAGSGEMLSFQLARPGDFEKLTAHAAVGSTTPRPWMHRRVRPWFSVAASLCVGLMAGVVGHFLLGSADDADVQLAATPTGVVQEASSTNALPGRSTGLRTTAQAPIMNVNLSGLGNRNSQPVSIPVYSAEQWQSLQPLSPPAPLPQEVRQLLEAQGLTIEHERHWYRAPLEDGREILVPAETMRVKHTVQ